VTIGGRKMKKLTIVCIVFGLLHAAAMTMFALGPELSPLVVWIVDAPVAAFTIHAASPFVGYGVPIIACSILYPLVIFLIGWLGILIHRRRSARLSMSSVS
jgi:hypothetical protein